MLGISLKTLPDDIYNEDVQMEVDSPFATLWEMQSNASVGKRLLDSQGKYFGRRTLEVAYWNALSAKQKYTGIILSDWKKVASTADKLEMAFKQFLEALVYERDASKGYQNRKALPISEATLAPPINSVLIRRFFQNRTQNELPDYTDIKVQTKSYSKSLCNVQELVSVVKTVAKVQSTALSSNRQNEGIPELHAFTLAFVEAHVFLIGKTPSPANTKFKGLLALSWSDICDDEFDWTRQIRTANQAVKSNLFGLTSSGPDWL